MAAGDELEFAISVEFEVAIDVEPEVVVSVACGIDSEELERAALLPDGEQGLAAVVPMTTTWKSLKRFPGVAARTVYNSIISFFLCAKLAEFQPKAGCSSQHIM